MGKKAAISSQVTVGTGAEISTITGSGFVVKSATVTSQVTVGSGAAISTITGAGFVGNGSGLLLLTPENMKAGTLGTEVVASSIAIGVVWNQNIVSMDASKLFGTINLSNLNFDTYKKEVGGYNSTLGTGTTFFTMVPTKQVLLTKITVTIVVPGEDGTNGTIWKCGSTAENMLSVTTTKGLAAGSVISSVVGAPITVTATTPVNGWMDSTDEGITPSANVICEYN